MQTSTDRPRSSFQRSPAKGAAFPKTRVSFTITFACRPEGSLLLIARAGSSLTRPTLCPQAGDSVFDGRCKRHGAVTR
jgi:hypothetical protein